MRENIFGISSNRRRYVGSTITNATALASFVLALWPGELAAQGPPVDTGSHIPVALWFIGAGILGIVMVYGVLQNRKRTRAEVQRTEQATRDLYKEGRDRVG